MSDDLYAIIADQAETIDQFRAEIERLKDAEQDAVDRIPNGDDPYWSGVYDRIRAAWDRWALTELGTASPSPLDLVGKPELADLWEAVK